MLSFGILAVLSFILCQGIQNVVSSRSWFVHQNGTDFAGCGRRTVPCRSVRYTVGISNAGDNIYIDYVEGRPYMECGNETQPTSAIELRKSISFYGINGKPTIRCKKSCDLFVIKSSSLNKPKVLFSNLILTSTHTVVKCTQASFRLVFENTAVEDNFKGVYSTDSSYCSVFIHNSTFEENVHFAISLRCTYLTAHITSSTFKRSPVMLRTYYNQFAKYFQIFDAFVSKSVFDGEFTTTGADLLSVQPFAVIFNLSIWDSACLNHFETDGTVSSLAINDNSLWGNRSGTFVSLRNLRVENSFTKRPAIYLVSKFITQAPFVVEVLNSIFKNNSAAVTMKILNAKELSSSQSVILHNNTFEGNFNGPHRQNSVPAIYLNLGRYRVTSCRFIDNKAGKSPFSAVITVAELTNVAFLDCYFENSQTVSSAAQFYARGQSSVYFKGKNVFNIIALNRGQPIFIRIPFHEAKGVLLNRLFKIQCPQGYMLNSQKICDTYEKSSYCVYIYITCEQCPQKTYALARDEFNYNTTVEDLRCLPCPRGGTCKRGIVTARPNFWGYKTDREITFVQCPPGYCCDSNDCASYNSCQGKRNGTLCGRCSRGMSDSLFDSSCTANTKCSGYLFIPSAITILVLYLIFFLYHEKIVGVITKILFGSLRIFTAQRNERQQTPNTRHKSSGCLKIFFYYYQVVWLLQSTVGSQGRNQFADKLADIISRILDLVLVDLSYFSCPFQNLHPVEKSAILHSVGYCLIVLLGWLYLITVLARWIIKRVTAVDYQVVEMNFMPIGQVSQRQSRFIARIASAFTYISLLMYASSAKLYLSLLYCVPVGGDQVLFLDGNTICYQTFQYFLFAYMISSILPFCLVPVLGSYLLREDRICATQFCFACVFPLPFCCFWAYLLLKEYQLHKLGSNNGTRNMRRSNEGSGQHQGRAQRSCEGRGEVQSQADHQDQCHCLGHDIRQCHRCQSDLAEDNDCTVTYSTDEVNRTCIKTAILRVLVGPFRPHKAFLCFPEAIIPWEGFLIFRRLLLILVLTFVHDNRLKMIIALMLCVAIQTLHTYFKPFRRAFDNAIEAISLSILSVLCGITLIKMLYNGQIISSASKTFNLLHALDLVENTVVVAPALILVLLITLSVFIRLFVGFRNCLRFCYSKLN